MVSLQTGSSIDGIIKKIIPPFSIKYLELEACPHMLKSPGNMKINTCQGDNDMYTKC